MIGTGVKSQDRVSTRLSWGMVPISVRGSSECASQHFKSEPRPRHLDTADTLYGWTNYDPKVESQFNSVQLFPTTLRGQQLGGVCIECVAFLVELRNWQFYSNLTFMHILQLHPAYVLKAFWSFHFYTRSSFSDTLTCLYFIQLTSSQFSVCHYLTLRNNINQVNILSARI